MLLSKKLPNSQQCQSIFKNLFTLLYRGPPLWKFLVLSVSPAKTHAPHPSISQLFQHHRRHHPTEGDENHNLIRDRKPEPMAITFAKIKPVAPLSPKTTTEYQPNFHPSMIAIANCVFFSPAVVLAAAGWPKNPYHIGSQASKQPTNRKPHARRDIKF